MSEKLKWSPLVIAILALVAIFAAACGDDDGNNPVTQTATEKSQSITLDDPRVQELVSMVRSGEIKNADQLQVHAFRLGFTAEQVDSVINVIGVHTDLTLAAASPSPSPDGKASSTATQSATAEATATPTPSGENLKITSNYDLRGKKEAFVSNGWQVQTYEGVTDQMSGWFRKLKSPDPSLWPSFPNVPNSLVPEFRVVNGDEVPDGLEYGLDERNFCDNDICDMVVDARSYHLVTGDYDVGFASCKASDGVGCALAVFNVGDVSANFEDIHVNNGFSLTGRYWNGDTLWWGLWGLSSHVIANMTNYPTNGAGDDTLNDPDRTNAGTNCSVPTGCGGVHFTYAITSGNHVVLIATTTFNK